jgi:uridine kinase
MIDQVCNFIKIKKTDHPLCVAIDGIDAAGKSKLAKELVFPLRKTGRQIIHISLDSYLQPSSIRYKRGRESPEGYYYDSFNYLNLISDILEPLALDGDRKIRRSSFDIAFEKTSFSEIEGVNKDAIVLFDGVFLMRPELFNFWDIKIFIDISFEVAIDRVIDRDINKFGSVETVRKLYELRYFGGQRIYFDRCHPQSIADIILDNNDPKDPYLYIQRPVA